MSYIVNKFEHVGWGTDAKVGGARSLYGEGSWLGPRTCTLSRHLNRQTLIKTLASHNFVEGTAHLVMPASKKVWPSLSNWRQNREYDIVWKNCTNRHNGLEQECFWFWTKTCSARACHQSCPSHLVFRYIMAHISGKTYRIEIEKWPLVPLFCSSVADIQCIGPEKPWSWKIFKLRSTLQQR